jgi:hypothetical protein
MPTDPSNLDVSALQRTRAWVNRYSWVVTLVSLGILIFCLNFFDPTLPPFFGWLFPHTHSVPVQYYFYDLSNGQLFAADTSALPPIPAPSGKKTPDGRDAGVRAIVFSCGDCKDEKQRYIGYLETFTPEAKETMISMMKQISTAPSSMPATQGMQDPMMYGRMIMDPQKPGWLTMDSPAAGKLIQESMGKCGPGKYPAQCFPKYAEREMSFY